MGRFIQEIQDFGKVIVSGSKIRMDDWLVSGKRGRHAEVPSTQGSDGLSTSQSSRATSEGPSQRSEDDYNGSGKSNFSDDVTEAGEEDETSVRSVNTDGQEEAEESSDSSYKRHKSHRRKEKRRAKKGKKQEKKKQED